MGSTDKTVFGRYWLRDEIASGGMATVHFGRLIGPVGFSRTVAIKRLHPHLARNPDFVAGFLDEARLAGRIRHPNVVPTLDIIATDGEVLLVMDYVQGETLARLLSAAAKAGSPPSPAIVSAIMCGALHGLHAAHEARSESGEPLHIVHRDVSPQNVLVGIDGLSRVLDFGIAKAANRSQETQDGALKGKLGYMSPEQASGRSLDRRSDVFSAGVVLWEALTASRLYPGTEGTAVIFRILHDPIPELPAAIHSPALQEVLRGSLAKDPEERFATALELARALERALPPATARELGEWLTNTANEALESRAHVIARIESERIEEARAVEPPPSEVEMPRAPATTSPPSKRRRSGSLAAALVVTLVVLIGVAGYSLGARRSAPTASADAAPSPVVLAASDVSSSAPPPPPEPAPPTSVVIAKPKAPTASHATRAPAANPAPVRTPAANCQPPTYFDANGIKHIKPGCIR